MKFIRASILTSLILYISTHSISGQVTYVPLNHSVYRLLDYLAVSGDLTRPHQQKPYSRSEVLAWLDEALAKDPGTMIRAMIERYRNEFLDGEIHTLSVIQDDFQFFGDAIGRASTKVLTDQTPFHRLDLGGNIRGTIGSSLSYQTDIVTTTFLGNLDFQTGYGLKKDAAPITHHRNENAGSTNLVQTQIITSVPWGYFSFGSDLMEWGPGQSGNLLLDIDQYSFNNIHVAAHLGRFRFTQVFAVLDKLYPRIEGGEKIYDASDRKLVAHRLDIFISHRLQFGVGESVIYNRGLELAYLNPLLPLNIGEIEAGDKDNNLASVDFTIHPIRGLRTYGEIFVDDINFLQNLFTYFGNKWAILVGSQWAEPFHMEGTLFTAEIVRIEPWVYSHRDSANIYEFYGQSIGYDLEPNSLKILGSLDWFYRPNLWFRLSGTWSKHGEGDRNFGIPEDIQTPKEFLGGPVETRMRVQLDLEYEFRQNMWFRSRLWQESIRNERIDDTFDEWVKNRESVLGLQFSLDLNY